MAEVPVSSTMSPMRQVCLASHLLMDSSSVKPENQGARRLCLADCIIDERMPSKAKKGGMSRTPSPSSLLRQNATRQSKHMEKKGPATPGEVTPRERLQTAFRVQRDVNGESTHLGPESWRLDIPNAGSCSSAHSPSNLVGTPGTMNTWSCDESTAMSMPLVPSPPFCVVARQNKPECARKQPKDKRSDASQPQANSVVSVGSMGHPLYGAEPCKYNQRRRGCKDGAACDRCHLCDWKRHEIPSGQ